MYLTPSAVQSSVVSTPALCHSSTEQPGISRLEKVTVVCSVGWSGGNGGGRFWAASVSAGLCTGIMG